MKQYIFNWNPTTQIREVLVYENANLITVLELPNNYEINNYLEQAYVDGNFFTSNKNIENIIECEEIPSRKYQHYKIEEENEKYYLTTGKTWDDESIKKFSKEDDDIIKIVSTYPNKEVKISYYDCNLRQESLEKSKEIQKIKKLVY